MEKKFFLGILTSSNERLLKISYESAKHQYGHNLDYDIVIIVNSLDKSYYGKVVKILDGENVDIIETESNGKPGKGHNSVINMFRNRKQYDYMLLLDGDDFLYPYALHQLSKCFEKHEHLDMLMLKSTDKLNVIEDTLDIFDINLNNNFTIGSKLYVDYKLYPWNKEHIKISNCFENSLCTPLRLFMLNRNILDLCSILYEENCVLYDDYLVFLYFIRFCQKNALKCFIIPGKYIYLYNSINLNSMTHNTGNNNDMEIYDKIKWGFRDCYDYLTQEWDVTRLPTMYISHYKNVDYDYKILEDTYALSMNINVNSIYNDENYKYIKNTGINIVNKIMDMYYEVVVERFENGDYENIIKYSEIFNIANIKNANISFMYLYALYKTNTQISKELAKKHKLIGQTIIEFYNIQQFNTFLLEFISTK